MCVFVSGWLFGLLLVDYLIMLVVDCLDCVLGEWERFIFGYLWGGSRCFKDGWRYGGIGGLV